MPQEIAVEDLTPEEWQFVYNSLVSLTDISGDQAAQYAASIFMVEPVFEFPTGAPPLGTLREFDDPTRKEVITLTMKELMTRAHREGYFIAGTVDIVQWRSHALALSKAHVYSKEENAAIFLWGLSSPEGPVTFWIQSKNATRWLKIHLRVALKPKTN